LGHSQVLHIHGRIVTKPKANDNHLLVAFASNVYKRLTVTAGSDHAGASEWIRNGGQVSFQGLGDLNDLSSTKVLSIFSERLESMPWGLAQRFKHVLMSLETE